MATKVKNSPSNYSPHSLILLSPHSLIEKEKGNRGRTLIALSFQKAESWWFLIN